jgi:hypothetical protein
LPLQLRPQPQSLEIALKSSLVIFARSLGGRFVFASATLPSIGRQSKASGFVSVPRTQRSA